VKQFNVPKLTLVRLIYTVSHAASFYPSLLQKLINNLWDCSPPIKSLTKRQVHLVYIGTTSLVSKHGTNSPNDDFKTFGGGYWQEYQPSLWKNLSLAQLTKRKENEKNIASETNKPNPHGFLFSTPFFSHVTYPLTTYSWNAWTLALISQKFVSVNIRKTFLAWAYLWGNTCFSCILISCIFNANFIFSQKSHYYAIRRDTRFSGNVFEVLIQL